MDILAKVKFSSFKGIRPTIEEKNTIDGKRIVLFSENWLHVKFEDHSSMFSIFTTSSEDISTCT